MLKQDLHLGFRFAWRQKLTWSILVLGAALFCATLYLVVSSFIYFNQDRPSWVSQARPLFTLGGISPNGTLEPLNLQAIEQVKQHSSISEMSIIGKGFSAKFRVGDVIFDTTPTFYSANLFEVLQPKPALKSVDTQGVWISASFWQQELKGMDLTGQYLTLIEHDIRLPIAGVLPAEVALPAPLTDGIWLPLETQKQFIKVTFNIPLPSEVQDEFKAKLAMKMNIYYGIFTAKHSPTLANLQADVQESQRKDAATSEDVKVYTRELRWTVLAGFVLNPEQKSALRRLATMSGYLAIAIGLVVFLSLLSYFWNNMVSRQQEFELRIALGASGWQLFTQLLREQTWFLLALAVFSSLLIVISQQLLFDSFLQQARDHRALVLSGMITLAVLLTVFSLCLLFPLFSLLRKNIFRRGKAGQLTPAQRLFITTNRQIQAAIALLLVSFGYGFYLSSLSLRHATLIDTSLRQVSIEGKDQQKITWQILDQHLKQTGFYHEVLLLSDVVVQPKELTLAVSPTSVDDPNNVVLPTYFVSSNFFQKLGLSEHAVQSNQVWLNKAAMTRLALMGEEKPYLYIKDNPLNVSDKNAGLSVAAVVENLPHFGMLKTQEPVLYLPLQDASALFSNAMLLYPARYEAQMQQFLQQLRDVYGTNITIRTQGSIAEQLAQINQLEILLMETLLILAALMVGVVALSFYSLMDAEICRQQATFGVMQAVGADMLDLLLTQYRQLIPVLLGASLVWVMTVLLLNDWLLLHFATDLWQGRVLLVGVLVLGLTLVLSCALPFMRMATQQIAHQLRYQG